MKTKRTKLALIGMAALILAGLLAAADASQPNRIVVPLSNPAKPVKVEVSSMRGAIKVIGYEGKEVIVETSVPEKALGKDENEEAEEKDAEEAQEAAKAQAKAAGMKRIPLDNAGLTAEESNNVVSIEVESWKRAMDLTVKVPFNSSLKLEAQQNGSIAVENVTGEIEVENLNGGITLTNVSGSVTANTLNGDIKVGLAKVAADKPMSFSTMNGDLDVTFPADTKANLKIKTERGEVYSDFDIALRQVPQKSTENPKKEGGKFRISLDSAFYGTINGGGPDYQFENFNGDIYLRKKK